jgi:hypothetical protein
MGSSGLFEAWRIIEVGAVVWFYEGRGGEYEYWPDGLDGPKLSVRGPLTNTALVADNDRMYHRIGWIGEPTAKIPAISPVAQIEHTGTDWVISDGGREVHRYSDQQIRISILWKGRVRLDVDGEDELTAERIVHVFQSNLVSRGVNVSVPSSPLSDQAWLDRVHSTYYSPIELTE